MRNSLPLDRFPGANPLIRDYASDFARVGPWFHYDPHQEADLSQRLAELAGRPARDRLQASAAVVRQQEQWRAGAAAVEAARALGQPGTFAVVTGQQAGLFGGPLYAVLKAASAVKLAARLAAQFPQRRFVPTFWIASGDSDFDEVRTTSIIGADGSLCDFALAHESPADEGRIVGVRDVAEDIRQQLGMVESLAPNGEHRADVLAALHEAYSDGNLVHGFARWLARLFDGTELVLLDPQDPALMACASELIARELSAPMECAEALAARNAAIAAAGYPLQVEQLPADTNLFFVDDAGVRQKISRAEAGFVLRPSGQQFSAAALQKLAAEQPAAFVCGVMLRPVYQNVLFPPAAFVGGGAEIAYRAQATAVFDFHGEQMAPAFLRASATLLTPRQAQLLDELGWELPDCYVLPQDLAARAVDGQRNPELERAVSAHREALLAADRQLQEFAVGLDPSLGQSFETLRDNLLRHSEKLEKKIVSALKQKHSAMVSQVGRLHTLVYPGLTVQERRLNLLSFLPRHGFGLVGRLLEQLEFPCWEHQAVMLE